jgi:hypothetical protein
MDVKTAFLNGNIEEELYMVQPESFANPKDPNKICKLQGSNYGLKQASRSWNLHFDEVIKGFGFVQKYRGVLYLQENEWELSFIPGTICGRYITDRE